jgi:hypothetical protein
VRSGVCGDRLSRARGAPTPSSPDAEHAAGSQLGVPTAHRSAEAAPPDAAGTSLPHLVMRLDNSQIRWVAYAGNYTLPIVRPGSPKPCPGTAAAALWRACSSVEVERPLLSALDDPDRFVAAHVLLVRRTELRGEKMPGWGYETDDDGTEFLGPPARRTAPAPAYRSRASHRCSATTTACASA